MIGLFACVPLVLAGCGSQDPAADPPDAPAETTAGDDGPEGDAEAGTGEATITIKDFAYGEPLTVAPGTTVTVVNEDSAPHNANDADGAFEEPLIDPGGSDTFTAPDEAGSYDLICTQHPDMSGELIVEG